MPIFEHIFNIVTVEDVNANEDDDEANDESKKVLEIEGFYNVT